ncbi:MAG: hypothetical protein Q4A09_06375 [Capnocytophaga felis]|nr:hypothetical protein [Capnocytophaga felis]
MKLTKVVLNYFSEKGEKQKRRMQLALACNVSFDTINRWLDQDNEKFDTSKNKKALTEVSGFIEKELFNK